MKTLFKIIFPAACVLLIAKSTLYAQKGDQYAKLGATTFFLNGGKGISHCLMSLGASYEYQFDGQISGNLNLNTARLVGAIPSESDGYIRNSNSAEVEIRFYPNNKGKGFYAGVSAVYYLDERVKGLVSTKHKHWGSHINAGFQLLLTHHFYLQANGQAGIYRGGFSTVSRYGLNLMLGKRF